MRKQILSLASFALFIAFIGIAIAEDRPESTNSEIRYDLARSIDEALKSNYDIRAAKERVAKQYGVLVEARARFFPRLDASGNISKVSRSTVPSFGGQNFGDNRDWAIDVVASENIFAGGRDIGLINQASSRREAARFELNSVISNVLLEVKTKFYGTLLADAKLKVQEANVGLLEEELRIEKEKLASGTVSDFNVLRAEVALANGQTPLIKARNELRLSKEDLARVIGLPVAITMIGEPPIVVEGSLQFEPFEMSLEDSIKSAYQNRQELKQLHALIEAAESGVTAARSGYLPSVDVQGGYQVKKDSFSSDIHDDLRGWKVGAQASWNIFDGLGTTGRIDQAQSDRRSANILLGKTKLDIGVEVRRAFSSLLEARELVTASNKVVEQASEALRLARARFDAGVSPQIDILDSQVALTQARTNAVQALYDYNIARSTLERDIGINH